MDVARRPYPSDMASLSCERCGLPLPDEARFCPNCGYPVGAPLAEERKVVTVIFVDLVGSTKLSAQVDPERYREVLTRYYRMVSEELESLRGRAYNFAGDAVVGVFGLQHTHDDDALRAVRAGLALVERIGRLGHEIGLPVPLQVRVGIHTGPVAIGSEASDQGLIFGATVNLAARLQQAADPGTVLVSDTGYLLSQSQVEYGPMREVEAKGFEEEAAAWPVVALQPGTSRRTIPFVDRKHELRLLQDAFEGARENRHGHLVTLLGEIGHRQEPARRGVHVRPARGREGALRPREPVRGGLDVRAARPDPPARDRGAGRRGAGGGPGAARGARRRLSPGGRDAAGRRRASGSRSGSGMTEPHDETRRFPVADIRSGLLALLEGFGAPGPVVLVLEDLHAAQPAMLDLVEHVVPEARGHPAAGPVRCSLRPAR